MHCQVKASGSLKFLFLKVLLQGQTVIQAYLCIAAGHACANGGRQRRASALAATRKVSDYIVQESKSIRVSAGPSSRMVACFIVSHFTCH